MARAYKKNSQIDEAEDVLAALKEREVDNMRFSGKKMFYKAIYWTIGYAARGPPSPYYSWRCSSRPAWARAYMLKNMGYIQPAARSVPVGACVRQL